MPTTYQPRTSWTLTANDDGSRTTAWSFAGHGLDHVAMLTGYAGDEPNEVDDRLFYYDGAKGTVVLRQHYTMTAEQQVAVFTALSRASAILPLLQNPLDVSLRERYVGYARGAMNTRVLRVERPRSTATYWRRYVRRTPACSPRPHSAPR
jgi:hypothetical protein